MEPDKDEDIEENEEDGEMPNQKHMHGKDGECCGGHGRGHGPGHGPRHGMPPHLMRQLMEMQEKIGKLEGMMEVLLKKMD